MQAVAVPVIAALCVLAACGGTPGWSLLAHNFTIGNDVIIRVQADGVTVDRLVTHDHPVVLAYAGPVRPQSVSIALVDPETCAIVDQVDHLPNNHATIVVDMRMELIVGEEDPNGLDGLSLAAPTSLCADDGTL